MKREFNYNLDRTLDEIRPEYYMDETCQRTVPEAIIAFLESKDFEDVVRNAVSLGGDTDTLGAITGSIAEAFFKERGIKYQFIDMKEKGMSKGEFNSVAQANGGLENMVNWDGKDKDLLALIKYIADEDKLEKVIENPQVIKTPVVRNGKQSTLGYQPDIWKGWN